MARHVRRPKQQRSEQTLARILAAAEALLYERGAVDIPVRDICERAETSPSSFYARFPDKSALLHSLLDRLCERVFDRIDALRAPLPGEDFAGFVKRAIETLQLLFRRERRLDQALGLAAESDEKLLARRRWLDSQIKARAFAVATERFPELDWKRIEERVEDGLPIIAAAFRGGVEAPGDLGLEDTSAQQKVVRDLSALILRFAEGED
ncbi:MAG: hypothetical protein CL910_06345 [Deltaproteobacteria bacterium]|jgi:AcrR family transcriptional regulator|nr:hypothetical protein [Deltaproteobacteria bacterium]